MEILKIKETCLYVNYLDKAYEFYHTLLGLPVINFLPGKHLFLRCGESVLLLFNPEDSKHKKSPPAYFGGGNQHFAFEVPEKDYQKTKEELIAKGILIIDEVTWSTGKKSFYFNDPEGNVLEIIPEDGIWN
jgi:catechol 2,3-dioxygenase-like lactoylglutathione lyase family enzyme